jgi:hypothetical protein
MAGKEMITDWAEIKKAYLASHIESVNAFRGTSKDYTKFSLATWKNNTKGWRAEKDALRQAQIDSAKRKLLRNDKVEDFTEMLLKGKKLILQSVLLRVQDNNKRLSMSEQKIAVDIIKRELGEPLNVVENTNKNLNVEMPDAEVQSFVKELSEERPQLIKELMDKLLNNE